MTAAAPIDDHRHNNFDLLRLIAALQVVFSHAQGWLSLHGIPKPIVVAMAAMPGVPVFFVVSGFLVTRSFVHGDGGVLAFFWRRALRIYPALWMHFLVILAMLWVGGALVVESLGHGSFWLWLATAFVTGNDFWANVVAGNTFDYSGFYRWFPSGVLWSLSAELGFYGLVALVFCAPLRRRGLVPAAIGACFAASLVCAAIASDWKAHWPRFNTTGELISSPAPHFWIFLIGAGIAWGWPRFRGLFVGRALAWAIAYAALCAVEFAAFGGLQERNLALAPMTVVHFLLLGGLVVACAFTRPATARVLRGIDLSYGLYLYHMPVIATLHYAGLADRAWLWFPVLFVPLACAGASWFLIERRALGWKRAYPLRIWLRRIKEAPIRKMTVSLR